LAEERPKLTWHIARAIIIKRLVNMSALSELYQEIARCQQCEIAKYRNRVVPGEGAEDAEVMFIGEAPGWHEDQQGRPFVGPAGKYLDELLASIGLTRQQVYIANVIKCRPQGNRDPLPTEIQNCRQWLERQIEIIHPKMIVTLGRYSMAMFFPGKSVSKIHGTAQKRDNVIYYAMYHPAAALHQASLRRAIEEDMLKIPSLLAQAETMAEAKQQPQQLTMF
jgi:uracil-DNA glycosylase family 4